MTEATTTMPAVPAEVFERIDNSFTKYLFYVSHKNYRKYYCTACRQEFEEGPARLKQTMMGADYILFDAKHRSNAVCPMCGKSGIVYNCARSTRERLYEKNAVAVFLPVAYDDVWVRCFFTERIYSGDFTPNCMTVRQIETNRYHFTPEGADFRKIFEYGRELLSTPHYEDPFIWNHGAWTEKYEYNMICGNEMTVDDTFLKYSGFPQAAQLFYDVPLLRYYCHYSDHPQLEMIVKLGLSDIASDILSGKQNYRFMNWDATKPWDLLSLTHAEYNIWRDHCYSNMEALKVFHRMHGHGEKDMLLAYEMLTVFSEYECRYSKLSEIYSLIANARKFKADVRDVWKYICKVQEHSAGECWHCPGISMWDAITLWCDYADLVKKAGLTKVRPAMPKDLKAAHDELLSELNKRERAKKREQQKLMEKEAKARDRADARRIEKEFPHLTQIYSEIKPRYEYAGEKFCIVVPDGAYDIIRESRELRHCICRVDRYYKRIEHNVSYIMFLRRANAPKKPFYTLEVEPGGAVRQKRSYDDNQYDDLKEATEFLREWQESLRERLTADDIALAAESKKTRKREYEELRQNKTVVRTGYLTGKLLADVLEADLVDISWDAEVEIEKQRKVG